MRVAVVGAGFAGLAAADALAAAGVEVIVLEARDRVGGRVWSRELENGAVVEMGAEFILPGNDTIRSYVDRFGLGLWDKGMLYGDREPRGGIGVDRRRHARRGRAGSARRCPAVEAGVSAAALLDSLPLDPGAREAIQARLEVSSAATADRVEATALAGLAAHSDDVCPSVAGGNQRVALALAARARRRPCTSRAPSSGWPGATARRRRRGGGRRDRRSTGSCSRCPRASSAGSPSTRRCPSRSAPPTPPSSTATRPSSSCRSRERPPPSAVLSVPERYWSWTATGGDGVQPVVNAFAGSAPASPGSRSRTGPATWLASLARLRPDLALSPDDGRALDLGRRPVGRRRVLVRAPAAGGLGPGRAVPRLRRAHPRLEPGADGRRARERAAGGAGDPRAPA